MKWLRTLILFDKGNVVSTNDWKSFHESYLRSIASVDHPSGSGSLILRKKTKEGKQWNRNGVVYLKSRFLHHMKTVEGWQPEGIMVLKKDQEPPVLKLFPSLERYQEKITSKFGGFDFTTHGHEGTRIAIEWETGNISSSHRSMNKLAIALEAGIIDIGVTIVPSRDLYQHLTDRIGNIGELSGYLAMWSGLGSTVKRGLLAITVVEHDDLTEDETHPYLRSGDDGNARKGRKKLST